MHTIGLECAESYHCCQTPSSTPCAPSMSQPSILDWAAHNRPSLLRLLRLLLLPYPLHPLASRRPDLRESHCQINKEWKCEQSCATIRQATHPRKRKRHGCAVSVILLRAMLKGSERHSRSGPVHCDILLVFTKRETMSRSLPTTSIVPDSLPQLSTVTSATPLKWEPQHQTDTETYDRCYQCM